MMPYVRVVHVSFTYLVEDDCERSIWRQISENHDHMRVSLEIRFDFVTGEKSQPENQYTEFWPLEGGGGWIGK